MGENIFLFVPNIIGYGRIALALISYYYMPTDYGKAAVCYLVSGLLDAFDGQAARVFNQSTKFGAMLDMLTDRCGTMCLCMCLSVFYPSYLIFFQLVCTIDIAMHWLHLHTSVMQKQTSHKDASANLNPILAFYYTSKPFLFVMCSGNELFYASLYLLHFTEGPFMLWRVLSYVLLPVAVLKTVLALMQGQQAAQNMAVMDVEERAKLR